MNPYVKILDRPIGHFFFLVGRQKAVLCLQDSQYGGLVGKECEEGSLKTLGLVKFSAECMAVPICSGCFEISIT